MLNGGSGGGGVGEGVCGGDGVGIMVQDWSYDISVVLDGNST